MKKNINCWLRPYGYSTPKVISKQIFKISDIFVDLNMSKIANKNFKLFKNLKISY